MQNENEKNPIAGATRAVSVGERVNEFIQKYRKIIFAFAILIVVALVASITALSVMDTLNGKAISAVEELGSRYETLRPTITGADSGEYADIDVIELLSDIEIFARKNSGYAGGRAWSLVAAIYGDKEDWALAEAAWVSAAGSAKKTYLVPVAFFNAGAAAEEQGNVAAAIEHYTNCLVWADDFPSAARAQFSIGRLQESLNDTDAAIAAYQAVISGWPFDRVWPNLARSRIIALEAE